VTFTNALQKWSCGDLCPHSARCVEWQISNIILTAHRSRRFILRPGSLFMSVSFDFFSSRSFFHVMIIPRLFSGCTSPWHLPKAKLSELNTFAIILLSPIEKKERLPRKHCWVKNSIGSLPFCKFSCASSLELESYVWHLGLVQNLSCSLHQSTYM